MVRGCDGGGYDGVYALSLSQAIAYFVHTMELVVNRDYVLVYFHSQSLSENQPDSSFFKQIYTMVDPK